MDEIDYESFDANDRAADELIRRARIEPERAHDDDQPHRQHEAASARWNDWLDERVEPKLKELGAEIVDLVADVLGDVVKNYDAELQKLHDEIGAMRADLTVTSALARGEIKELKARDAA